MRWIEHSWIRNSALLAGLLAIGFAMGGCRPASDAPPGTNDAASNTDSSSADVVTIDAGAAGLSTDDLVLPSEPDKPTSLPSAMAELVSLRDTIRDGMKSGDFAAAHGPLHDVGHVLEAIAELADAADLNADQEQAVAEQVEVLFESFGAVDAELFHGGDHGEKDAAVYDEVAGKIDAAVTSLQSLVGSLKETKNE